jgi:hypothetical protein
VHSFIVIRCVVFTYGLKITQVSETTTVLALDCNNPVLLAHVLRFRNSRDLIFVISGRKSTKRREDVENYDEASRWSVDGEVSSKQVVGCVADC